MNKLFAHAEEVHEDVVEAVGHGAGVDPLLIVLGVIILGAIAVVAIQLLLKKPNITVAVALVLLFFIGVFAYSASPVISATAIISGFVLSLALAFGGISASK